MHHTEWAKKKIATLEPMLQTASSLSSFFLQKEKFIKICWEEKASIPVDISSPIIVKIGDHVYVSGGNRKDKKEGKLILQYHIPRDTWNTLPSSPTCCHALATLNNQLLVVGGIHSTNISTNKVFTWMGNKWKEILPPMPTARCHPTTLSHNNRIIIAAGGITEITATGDQVKTSSIEIYIKNEQWYRAGNLPSPMSNLTLTSIDDMCYILGGSIGTTMEASLNSLSKSAVHSSQRTGEKISWKTLQSRHPLVYPSLVGINQVLVAMGGSCDKVKRRGSKFISAYNFATETWVECEDAELPVPLYRTGVLQLDHNKVMLIGGQTKLQTLSSQVYIGSLY